MPEHAFDMEEFKKSLKAALEQETAVVVCVSEGIADKDGRFICDCLLYTSPSPRD